MTDLLRNPVKNYDWGSHTAIATLAGRPSPAERPEAEMLGSAPTRPAPRRCCGRGRGTPSPRRRPPTRWPSWGQETVERFGARFRRTC